MGRLVAYIRRRKKLFLFFLLCCGIFCFVFYLYRLPVEAVGYAFILCVTAGGVPLILDYLDYRKRRDTLRWLAGQLRDIDDYLPVPGNEVEAEYQELIRTLHRSLLQERAEAVRSRSDMLEYYTMWAHQIKTPIAAMDLLLQSEEELKKNLVEEQLFRIREYVEMVLTYLRMEDMSADLDLHRSDLDTIVRAAVKKYSRTFIHKHLRLNYEPLSRQVLTDEKWLQFVIEQVLSNALKYTRNGSISIYMDPDHACRLVIADTGIGIRPEDLPRVFERGFTGQNGRVDKNATGIGLYLCRRIMEKLSHRIGISSVDGQGTQVWLDMETVEIKWE